MPDSLPHSPSPSLPLSKLLCHSQLSPVTALAPLPPMDARPPGRPCVSNCAPARQHTACTCRGHSTPLHCVSRREVTKQRPKVERVLVTEDHQGRHEGTRHFSGVSGGETQGTYPQGKWRAKRGLSTEYLCPSSPPGHTRPFSALQAAGETWVPFPAVLLMLHLRVPGSEGSQLLKHRLQSLRRLPSVL